MKRQGVVSHDPVTGRRLDGSSFWLCVAAVVFVVVRTSGVEVPQWVYHILGILLLCILAVVAIKILAGL